MAPTQTARIVFPLPLDKSFSYLVPSHLEEVCQVGARAMAPFGKRTRVGVVVALDSVPDFPQSLKPILKVLDESPLLDFELLRFTQWVSEYYFSPWGLLVQAALPVSMRVPRECRWFITEEGQEQLEHPFSDLRPAERKILETLARKGPTLTGRLKKLVPGIEGPTGRRLLERALVRTLEPRVPPPTPRLEEWACLARPYLEPPTMGLGVKQKSILTRLAQGQAPVQVSDLLRAVAAPRSSLISLERKGWISLEKRPRTGVPTGLPTPPRFPPLPLSLDQQKAVQSVVESLDRMRYQAFLLRGVTGSGKTEVYLSAASAAMKRGRTVLYLVPEIGLTPLLVQRLLGRFPGQVALWHSGLTQGERRDQWNSIREGKSRLIVGTRSALFAPAPQIGLMVIDEEQDPSYVQSESPRYNARNAALVRAQGLGATVILGSATPSVEAVASVAQKKLDLLELPERIRARPMPEVRLIDMREEFRRKGVQSTLSEELCRAILETHKRGEQAIILLNRRGYAAFILCRACGQKMECRSCSIALTYHRSEERLRCHYCNQTYALPRTCPHCGSPHLHQGGAGTQRLEDAVRKLDPKIFLARMDRDTVGVKQHARLLERFSKGDIHILVGTQMVAKGHDFPGVTLVGVIGADQYLGFPDFRAAERTYQILTQVAGRAGRGDRPGRVLIQAYATQHYALEAVMRGEPRLFYDRELRLRKALRYPPWVALSQVLVRERSFNRGQRMAQKTAETLRQVSSRRYEVLGPAPSPLSRIRGEYRFQILVRGTTRRHIADGIRETLARLEKLGVPSRSLIVESDPMSLL